MPQLSRYEHDTSHPSSEMLTALAKGLGVTPDWLLGFSEEQQFDGLTTLELEAVALLRTKPPDRQEVLIEILRAATKL